MDCERLELQVATRDTGVVEARRNLVVLATPADEGLVKAIHPDEIALPVRLVATPDRPLSGAFTKHHATQKQTANGVPASLDVRGKESEIQQPLIQHAGGGFSP